MYMLDFLMPQVCWRKANLGRFAPASCCVRVQVYASMWIVVADPVMSRHGSTGLDLWIQRVSACPVRMLKIRMTEDQDSREATG